MLFTSYAFVFAFLPISLAGFFVAARAGRMAAACGWFLHHFFFMGGGIPAICRF
jgi:hypothetical protein